MRGAPSAGALAPVFTAPAVVPAGAGAGFNPGASSSTAGVSSSTWSFGDGASSFAPGGPASASRTFAVPGSYSVTLTLVDRHGRLAMTTHVVRAAVVPVASFSASASRVSGSAEKRLAHHHSNSESATVVYTPANGARITKKQSVTIRR